MRVLIDTNVLLRIADSLHASHQLAAEAVKALRTAHDELFIVPQSIYEFWSVATRSLEANGLGKPPAYAEMMVSKFCGVFRLLRDERSIFETWLQLVTQHGVSGVKSFDARLAAAMLRHDVTHLLTFNPGDFRRFSHITILEPTHIVQGQV
jgi:predicted nucleic acid-binding protein